jgi:hypothetical protein
MEHDNDRQYNSREYCPNDPKGHTFTLPFAWNAANSGNNPTCHCGFVDHTREEGK